MNKTALILPALVFLTSCAHFKTLTTANNQATKTTSTSDVPSAPALARAPAPSPTPATKPVKPESVSKPDTSLQPRGIDFGATIRVISFGASANQELPQPLWKTIAEAQPDLFLFMGDSIRLPKNGKKSHKNLYRKFDSIPEYRAFRETVPFMATWDDQDYDPKEFVKYWSYVGNSTTFGQKGIYHSKIIGPKKKQVQVVMLDTRTFRSSVTDAKATLLGDAQWSWLEEQLRRPAQVRIVVSSIPLIATDHVSAQSSDKWAQYPQERERFFDLLRKTGARNVVVTSGDRRQSSIAKTSVKDWGILFDVTASPINEPAAAVEGDSSFEGPAYATESFGLAQIDWQGKKMSLQIRDANGNVLNSVSFKLR